MVLALCVIIIGLSFIPGLNYEGSAFFGISAANDVNGKRLVFGVLWLLLTYHAIFLALHAYQDWRDWLGPRLAPAAGGTPRQAIWKRISLEETLPDRVDATVSRFRWKVDEQQAVQSIAR